MNGKLRRPDLMLSMWSPARALRALAARRHAWECAEVGSTSCRSCYRRCSSMPCVLLPVEAATMLRDGFGGDLALRVASVGCSPVDVLYVAPDGYEGGRMPISAGRAPCSMLWPSNDGRAMACGMYTRPVASVIRACGNWKSRSGSGKFVKDYARKLEEAETLYYGLAVLLWSRKYGKYVSTLWKETVLYGR